MITLSTSYPDTNIPDQLLPEREAKPHLQFVTVLAKPMAKTEVIMT